MYESSLIVIEFYTCLEQKNMIHQHSLNCCVLSPLLRKMKQLWIKSKVGKRSIIPNKFSLPLHFFLSPTPTCCMWMFSLPGKHMKCVALHVSPIGVRDAAHTSLVMNLCFCAGGFVLHKGPLCWFHFCMLLLCVWSGDLVSEEHLLCWEKLWREEEVAAAVEPWEEATSLRNGSERDECFGNALHFAGAMSRAATARRIMFPLSSVTLPFGWHWHRLAILTWRSIYRKGESDDASPRACVGRGPHAFTLSYRQLFGNTLSQLRIPLRTQVSANRHCSIAFSSLMLLPLPPPESCA